MSRNEGDVRQTLAKHKDYCLSNSLSHPLLKGKVTNLGRALDPGASVSAWSKVMREYLEDIVKWLAQEWTGNTFGSFGDAVNAVRDTRKIESGFALQARSLYTSVKLDNIGAAAPSPSQVATFMDNFLKLVRLINDALYSASQPNPISQNTPAPISPTSHPSLPGLPRQHVAPPAPGGLPQPAPSVANWPATSPIANANGGGGVTSRSAGQDPPAPTPQFTQPQPGFPSQRVAPPFPGGIPQPPLPVSNPGGGAASQDPPVTTAQLTQPQPSGLLSQYVAPPHRGGFLHEVIMSPAEEAALKEMRTLKTECIENQAGHPRLKEQIEKMGHKLDLERRPVDKVNWWVEFRRRLEAIVRLVAKVGTGEKYGSFSDALHAARNKQMIDSDTKRKARQVYNRLSETVMHSPKDPDDDTLIIPSIQDSVAVLTTILQICRVANEALTRNKNAPTGGGGAASGASSAGWKGTTRAHPSVEQVVAALLQQSGTLKNPKIRHAVALLSNRILHHELKKTHADDKVQQQRDKVQQQRNEVRVAVAKVTKVTKGRQNLVAHTRRIEEMLTQVVNPALPFSKTVGPLIQLFSDFATLVDTELSGGGQPTAAAAAAAAAAPPPPPQSNKLLLVHSNEISKMAAAIKQAGAATGKAKAAFNLIELNRTQNEQHKAAAPGKDRDEAERLVASFLPVCRQVKKDIERISEAIRGLPAGARMVGDPAVAACNKQFDEANTNFNPEEVDRLIRASSGALAPSHDMLVAAEAKDFAASVIVRLWNEASEMQREFEKGQKSLEIFAKNSTDEKEYKIRLEALQFMLAKWIRLGKESEDAAIQWRESNKVWKTEKDKGLSKPEFTKYAAKSGAISEEWRKLQGDIETALRDWCS